MSATRLLLMIPMFCPWLAVKGNATVVLDNKVIYIPLYPKAWALDNLIERLAWHSLCAFNPPLFGLPLPSSTPIHFKLSLSCHSLTQQVLNLAGFVTLATLTPQFTLAPLSPSYEIHDRAIYRCLSHSFSPSLQPSRPFYIIGRIGQYEYFHF